MNLVERADRFELNDHPVSHNEIHSVRRDRAISICHDKSLFRFERQLPSRHFKAHRISINELNKTRTELFVNDKTGIDDRAEDRLGGVW